MVNLPVPRKAPVPDFSGLPAQADPYACHQSAVRAWRLADELTIEVNRLRGGIEACERQGRWSWSYRHDLAWVARHLPCVVEYLRKQADIAPLFTQPREKARAPATRRRTTCRTNNQSTTLGSPSINLLRKEQTRWANNSRS